MAVFSHLPVLASFTIVSLAAAAPTQAQHFRVEQADEWTALFDRTRGWTGADGIYSIPITGYDRLNSADGSGTLFVFSDTAIGDVNDQGVRQPGTTLVNNTIAFMQEPEPLPENIAFYWGREGGNPRAVFVPQTPLSEPGEWYWMGDGVALGEAVYLTAYRIRSTGKGGVFGFEFTGTTMIKLPRTSRPPFADQEQFDTPFFIPETEDRGGVDFGGAIMANTKEAGAYNPDGYLYIYGVQNDPLVKKLLASRVRPEDIENFEAYRFWDGAGWVEDINAAAAITGRISNEHSVTPLPNGKYLLVYQEDAIGRDVAVRIGESPVGPFGPSRPIYTCPEPSFDEDWFTYNAKAHPHISGPGELLISYNVNTFDFFGDFFNNADSYRPRFIRLIYEP